MANGVHTFATWFRMRGWWQRFRRRNKRRFLGVKEPRGNLVLTPPRKVQKNIWIFWAQGLEQAPPVVKACVASWAERNPGWALRVLSREDLPGMVDASDISVDLPLAHQADVLRVRLLETHGGVWADATLYCMKPLDDWLMPLMQSGFFAFYRPGPDRQIDSWLLASEKGGLIVRQWNVRLTQYVRQREVVGHYFWPLYLFALEAVRSRAFGRAWAATPKVSADGPLMMQRFFQRGLGPEDLGPEFDLQAIPVHKLSWKPDKIDSLEAMRAWGLIPREAGDAAGDQAGAPARESVGGPD